jgi:predicted permease
MINILAVMIYLALGFVLCRIKAFPKNSSEILNLIVIYLALPALILEKFPLITFDSSILVPALSPWLMLLISVLIILAFNKILKFKSEVLGCLLLLIPLGNTSFLGIPMIEGLLGVKAVSYAIIYDQVGSFMALSIYGSAIVAIFSKDETSFSFKKAIKKIITFPPFISLMVALIFKFVWPAPRELNSIFAVLGNMLVPLAMISVGFQFKGSFEKKDLPLISGALFFKMLIFPLILFIILKGIGNINLPEATSILEAGMPPQITAGAVAMSMGLAPKLAAALVGCGILFSFISLPLLKYSLGL